MKKDRFKPAPAFLSLNVVPVCAPEVEDFRRRPFTFAYAAVLLLLLLAGCTPRQTRSQQMTSLPEARRGFRDHVGVEKRCEGTV